MGHTHSSQFTVKFSEIIGVTITGENYTEINAKLNLICVSDSLKLLNLTSPDLNDKNIIGIFVEKLKYNKNQKNSNCIYYVAIEKENKVVFLTARLSGKILSESICDNYYKDYDGEVKTLKKAVKKCILSKICNNFEK